MSYALLSAGRTFEKANLDRSLSGGLLVRRSRVLNHDFGPHDVTYNRVPKTRPFSTKTTSPKPKAKRLKAFQTAPDKSPTHRKE